MGCLPSRVSKEGSHCRGVQVGKVLCPTSGWRRCRVSAPSGLVGITSSRHLAMIWGVGGREGSVPAGICPSRALGKEGEVLILWVTSVQVCPGRSLPFLGLSEDPELKDDRRKDAFPGDGTPSLPAPVSPFSTTCSSPTDPPPAPLPVLAGRGRCLPPPPPSAPSPLHWKEEGGSPSIPTPLPADLPVPPRWDVPSFPIPALKPETGRREGDKKWGAFPSLPGCL